MTQPGSEEAEAVEKSEGGGSDPPKPVRSRAAQVAKAWRERRKANGLCVACGSAAVRLRCTRCFLRAKEQKRSIVRERNERGLCGNVKCSNQPLPGRALCQDEYDRLKALRAHRKRLGLRPKRYNQTRHRTIMEREGIRDALRKHGRATEQTLSYRIPHQPLNLGLTLAIMIRRGEIVRRGNYYCLPEIPPTPVSPNPLISPTNRVGNIESATPSEAR